MRTIDKLRAEAANGLIKGLMYVVDRADKHRGGLSGSYRDCPEMAVDIANQSMKRLYTYEARKRIDPLTASNYINTTLGNT